MTLHIFGVRHHGPGCARALARALEELRPDIVLVEGPPDAHGVLPLLAEEAMKPPVALLIYLPDQPHRAVYYPFTDFSPEWQALRYAFRSGTPARFMDLPQAIQLAIEPEVPEEAGEAQEPQGPKSSEGPAADAPAADPPARPDPLALLSEAAGYSDHELWWERQVEQRSDATGLFEGILEAMTTLRGLSEDEARTGDEHESEREAHMRQSIRAAQREGFQRMAVVCGAWHSPVLSRLDDVEADARILHGLRQVKVEATWIPWTNSRLSYRNGYGAGIASPGWYSLLWESVDRRAIHWVTNAARLLREQGLDASSASVIEAVRLGEALAAMGELPMPGMNELHEAIQTVLCNGAAEPMQLIREKLEIGERMGEVPLETPIVPLQRDLATQIRHLKLKQSPETVTLTLDLRGDTDRARSQLLHRLRLLGIDWGERLDTSSRAKGNFHENWRLKWEVDFVVALIERNIWGNTVESAAAGYARHRADEAKELPQLTALLNQANLASLPEAAEYLLARVESAAAVSADVRHLMDALPDLAQIARYGDVRGTKAERILPVIETLFARILIGLPGACASLDDEAAAAIVESIDNVQGTIKTLDRGDMLAEWLTVLRQRADADAVHGLVRGRCCRLLLEERALDEAELQRLARLALSPVVPADQATAWVEGVLRGGGQLLLQQDGLWRALDAWLVELKPDTFVGLLPLLRRAFSSFESPARRKMGEKVARLYNPEPVGEETDLPEINQQRADLVLPVLARVLGVAPNGGEA